MSTGSGRPDRGHPGEAPSLGRWVVLGSGVVLAGLAARAVGVPAPWLVGPMVAAVTLALLRPGARPEVPRWTRRAAQAVIGGVLAAAFEPSVVPLLAREWVPVALAVGGTIGLSLAAAALLARFAGIDGQTAATGTLPGAASGMLAIGEELGADPRVVALMQYGRVLLVVASAALVAGLGGAPGGDLSGGHFEGGGPAAWGLTALVSVVGGVAGAYLRLPAGAMMGPLLLGVALEQAGVASLAWPAGVPELAYATVGVYVGLLFDGASLREVGRLLPYLLLSTLSLIVGCAGLGWVFSVLAGVDYLTAFLATSPGAIDSVAVMAVGSGADASLVLAVQTVRLLAVVLAGAVVGRLWSAEE